MEMIAVMNSSPWIFLSELGLIRESANLFDELILPLSVCEEILQKRDIAAETLAEFRKEKPYAVCQAKNIRLLDSLNRRLGRGESEVITIALEKQTDMVLLDDHAARSEALRLGLDVKGTLGIIKRLMELGRYQCEVESLYLLLQKMNFRVSSRIFNMVFKTEIFRC
jgi:predicted nucleic acid-binding protein